MLNARIAALMTLPPLLWAGNAVVGRLLVGQVPPLALNMLRWWIAFALLLPLGWRVLRQWPLVRERFGHLALLSLLGVGSYNALQYLAVQTSSPINTTLIASSSPVFTLGLGWFVWGVRPKRAELIGAGCSLAGVLLVIGRGSLETLLSIRFVPGDVYMLFATLLWCAYSWMLARPPASMRGDRRPAWNWAEFLLVQIAFGGLWATAMAGAEQALQAPSIVWSPGVALALLYVAVGPSLIAYRCWGIGVATAGPAVATFFANLTPLFAAVLSAALLGEAPHWYHAAAFGLILAGIVVSSRASRASHGERG
jgi:drug/metabolite transporter (DMT)-like permease